MPKPRHDNPHAERQIKAYALSRWRSVREVEREQLALDLAERRRAELAAVDWGDLSPAELAFRWFLDRRESDGRYRAWAHLTLEAWKTSRGVGGHSH